MNAPLDRVEADLMRYEAAQEAQAEWSEQAVRDALMDALNDPATPACDAWLEWMQDEGTEALRALLFDENDPAYRYRLQFVNKQMELHGAAGVNAEYQLEVE